MTSPGPDRAHSPAEVRNTVAALEQTTAYGVATTVVASVLDVRDRTARRYLNDLVDDGVLERHRWPRPRTGGVLLLWRTADDER
jgi:predicted ArsR family transcriptional regulator